MHPCSWLSMDDIRVLIYVLKHIFFQDNLSFPLISPDWSADEEMLLLEVWTLSMGNSSVLVFLICYMLNDVCFST